MFVFLRKLFIKDYKNIENEHVRSAHGLFASILGLISNFILVILKLLAGILSGSIAIIADGINNLSDCASSLVGLIGFKMSKKPADRKHPYGHGRIEYIAGLIISFIIILLSFELFKESLSKIIHNEAASKITIITICILIVSILVKFWQGFMYLKMAKLIDSVSLKASSKDSFLDSISTFTILIGALIYYIWKINLDGYLGIVVAILIFISGLSALKDTSDPLIGISPEHSFVKKIIKDIEAYPICLGLHDVVCHAYGPSKCFMSAHVEINQEMSLIDAHNEIDKIENSIRDKYGVELTIHMDPIDTKSHDVKELQNEILRLLKDYDERFTIHDFRVVKGDTINVFFDLVIPYGKINQNDIILYLNSNLDKKYKLNIHFDHDFLE